MTDRIWNERGTFLSSPEEIIDEARNGRMFILVDDESRENEGDLVIPAQMTTPDAINFMARHGRGLICLALTKQRVEQLGLGLMSPRNGTRHETAFTVSIEARDGVSTGISAADRARTIAVAIDGARGRDDLATPGHVFPLAAREGGVLVRAGHTEAAVDVSRLAGLNPSGVICEIMKDDGTMARMDDLVPFAKTHNLKIGAIRDLIAYRMRHDHNIERISKSKFDSEFGGEWEVVAFRNTVVGVETLALIKGNLTFDKPVMVRMHAVDLFDDMLGGKGPRSRSIQKAMEVIAEHGAGLVVVITPIHNDILSRSVRAHSKSRINEGIDELRDYGLGAQVLAELGVHDMILLTSSHKSLIGLEGYGLNIVEERALSNNPI